MIRKTGGEISLAVQNTVNIYGQKTILANGNTDFISTNSKSFTSISKLPFFGKLPMEAIGNLPTNGNLPIKAKGIPGIG